MTNEFKQWLAEQIGLKTQMIKDVLHINIEGGWTPFEPEADSMQMAYVREKAVKWLGESNRIDAWYFKASEDSENPGAPDGWALSGKQAFMEMSTYATYEQAVIAAAMYVWEIER